MNFQNLPQATLKKKRERKTSFKSKSKLTKALNFTFPYTQIQTSISSPELLLFWYFILVKDSWKTKISGEVNQFLASYVLSRKYILMI